jgi:hypothetical protein
MDHLFNSVVRVEEMRLTQENGVADTSWVEVDDPALKNLPCRLDLNFVRPGKDILPAPVAGKAPDRIGVMFTYAHAPLKAGHRITAIPHPDTGALPVQGTFEIRVVPDVAIGFSAAHHIEVQIIEAAQKPQNFSWPGQAPS